MYIYIYSNYTIYKHIYLMSTCLHPRRPGNGQDATTLSSDILLWRACAFAAACSRIEPPPLEQKSGLKNEGNNIALKNKLQEKRHGTLRNVVGFGGLHCQTKKTWEKSLPAGHWAERTDSRKNYGERWWNFQRPKKTSCWIILGRKWWLPESTVYSGSWQREIRIFIGSTI